MNKNLRLLIDNMKRKKLDLFLVPRTDVYSSEEVPESEERLKFISNFSGSAGFAIISSNKKMKSAIFSDGRYQLQLKKEVNKDDFDVFNGGLREIVLFLKKNQKFINKIAIDPWLISKDNFNVLEKITSDTKINFQFIDINLIDEIWFNKPPEITNKIFELKKEIVGETSESKINRVIEILKKNNSDFYILFSPIGLSWLLNIRVMNLKHTPIFRGFCIISKSNELFIFSNNVNFYEKYFKKCKINLFDFEDLLSFLKNHFNKKFLIDTDVLPLKIYDYIIKEKLKFKLITCPVNQFKSIKNSKELKGFKNAHIRDGLAILKLLHWIELEQSSNSLSEISISKKLLEIRSLENTFLCESFETISAFNQNGAIIHYKVTENSNIKIDTNGLYLIDTGAHYLDGTTDTTRTIAIGNPNDEMINDYTLVLKSHIAISTAIFPATTKGRDLDVIARTPLWSCGKDYAHGTGHGVGFCLSVHEGPISISKISECLIESGMVISNEPGYYKKDKYGIRIENLEVVKKHNFKNSDTTFLRFENLTRVPLELSLIDKKMLNEIEINWINEYHKKVFLDLSKLIKSNDLELLKFLKRKTVPI